MHIYTYSDLFSLKHLELQHNCEGQLDSPRHPCSHPATVCHVIDFSKLNNFQYSPLPLILWRSLPRLSNHLFYAKCNGFASALVYVWPVSCGMTNSSLKLSSLGFCNSEECLFSPTGLSVLWGYYFIVHHSNVPIICLHFDRLYF